MISVVPFMFKFRKFIVDEEEKNCFEDKEKNSMEKKSKSIIVSIDSSTNVNHECFEHKHIPILKSNHLNIPFKTYALTKATRLVDFNFPEDLNCHGIACASIVFGTLTELKWLKNISGISDSKIQGANPFARIASFKVSGDKVTIDKSVEVSKKSLLDAMMKATLDKVDVIMASLSTDTLSNLSSCLCDPVNIGGDLAMKENIVVCTSLGNHGDRYYTLSEGSCNSSGKFITQVELGGGTHIKGFGSFMDKDGDYCKLIHWSEAVEVVETSKGKERKKKAKANAKIYQIVYEEQDRDLCKVTLKSGKRPYPYDPYVLKVMSGTSMTNAVVVGMLSYVKTFRKDWGIARIKSTIMTTAIPVIKSSDGVVLAMECGCINPLKAMNLGLVYDISPKEYKGMDINLPNFSFMLDKTLEYIFNRTMINGGCPKCSYKAEIRLYGRTDTSRSREEVILRSLMALRDQLLLAHAISIWREQKEHNGRNQCITVSSPIVILSKSLWEL
ncbi:hypothetical protein CXB51_025943 [Gossypium anomalum]|uniref:Peptidase S8/S53 domain-containing protein n=1 Tax=Gossypium anomalum TaxID=47600 RepID=A0A8J6CN67_9ROSI|nr:hypothetical protein CXB51_025943 [Gossypium anomalum]